LKFLTPDPVGPALPSKGIKESSRTLKRAEARGLFPRRVPIYPGASTKGWPEIIIDQHLEALADKCRTAAAANDRRSKPKGCKAR
jgi:hypothetical protein